MTVSKEKIHPYSFVGMKGLVHIPSSVLNIEEKIKLANEIIDTTCKYFAFESRETIIKKDRSEPVKTSRQVAIFLIKIMTDLPDKKISDLFNRDRTTIIHSIKLINGYVKMGHPEYVIEDMKAIKMLL
jgi:chromosomal replication initiation ATPase DnaA